MVSSALASTTVVMMRSFLSAGDQDMMIEVKCDHGGMICCVSQRRRYDTRELGDQKHGDQYADKATHRP